MKTYEATELAYKNGYAKGYADGFEDGKRSAVENNRPCEIETFTRADQL